MFLSEKSVASASSLHPYVISQLLDVPSNNFNNDWLKYKINNAPAINSPFIKNRELLQELSSKQSFNVPHVEFTDDTQIASAAPNSFDVRLPAISLPSITLAPARAPPLVKSSLIAPPPATRIPNRLEMIRSVAALNQSLNVFIPSDPHQMPRMNRIVLPHFTSIIQRGERTIFMPNNTNQGSIHARPIHIPNPINLKEADSIEHDISPFEIVLNDILTDVSINDHNEREVGIAGEIVEIGRDDVSSSIESNEFPGHDEELFDIFSKLIQLNPNKIRNEVNPSTIHVSAEIPVNGNIPRVHPNDIIENGIIINIENEENELVGNPDTISLFETILGGFGLEFDIDNPEFNIFNPNVATLNRISRGTKCISSNRKSVQGQ